MDHPTFNKILKERWDKIQNTLSYKSDEYSTKSDRFHNFKVAARISNCTPEQALKGIMVKHEASVQDMISWSKTDPEKITKALIDLKLGDNINYLLLLEGLFCERINK